MKYKYILLIFLISLTAPFVSALGISPAIKHINFEPFGEVNITFYILDASPDLFYDVSLRGGSLSSYSSLSANSINGGTSFILTIRFPEKIEPPGEQYIGVSIKERPSESSFINTVVEVGSIIKTFVPYPGIYGDLQLNIPDGNAGENIPVELYVINRGDNPLDINNVVIDFISSNGNLAKSMNFTPVSIPVSSDRYFRKYLDTSDIQSGNYIARARVSYSGLTNEVNKSFRVGSLFVNITNFTNSAFGKGIQKFYVSLENKWNSPVFGVFVDVNISNSIGEHHFFRTPSADLNPWEEKTIESYFDAEGMKGFYNLTLNASYHGKSTMAYGKFVIIDKTNMIYWISFAIAAAFFIIGLLIVKHFVFRRKK